MQSLQKAPNFPWGKIFAKRSRYANMHELKIDFHTHPLGHLYYPEVVTSTQMDAYEKSLIQQMIRIGIKRDLDAIALTDHNDFRGGFYGSRWAQQQGLPIKVIPGAELSVIIEGEEIHILALGANEAINFNPYDDFDLIIQAIQDAEGIAILAHPHYYPEIFPKLKDYIDGVEYYNGANASLNPQNQFFEELVDVEYEGLKTFGSDHHLPYKLRPEQLAGFTIVTEEMAQTIKHILK